MNIFDVVIVLVLIFLVLFALHRIRKNKGCPGYGCGECEKKDCKNWILSDDVHKTDT